MLGGLVQNADGAAERGVDLVAMSEGDFQEVGQVINVEAIGGSSAEGADNLLGARVDELRELRRGRTHVRIVPTLASSAKPGC